MNQVLQFYDYEKWQKIEFTSAQKDVGKLDKVLSNREDVHICLIDEDKIMEKIKKQNGSK